MATLFAAWTPAERWLAGLLWADGHILPDRSRGHRIILNLVDGDVIGLAAEVIGPAHRRYPPQPPRKPTWRPLHRLEFTDTLGALAGLGFGPKPERRWPAELASPELLRGLFDGDGYVGWVSDKRWPTLRYLKSAMGGPPAVLDGMQLWLSDQGISPKKVNRNGGGWQVQWSHRDSLRLAAIMYADAGPCLARKQAVFREPR